MSEITVEETPVEATIEVEEAHEHKKANRTEVWISRGFAEHMIAVDLNGRKDVAKFKDYKYTCDLSTKEGRLMSEGLHNSTREGRDIFVVGEAYPENELGKRTEMLKKLRDMTIGQLRSLLTLDEMIENNVPANTVDPDVLITLILKIKSI